MGFGYVFLGCLLTCNVTYHTYTDVFAVALMLLGLSTLAPYARGFSLSFKSGLPFLAVSGISFFVSLFKLIGLWEPNTMLVSTLAVVSLVCRFFFFWFFFMGVDEVARETDIQKLRAHALRSRFLTPIFCAAALFLEIGLFTEHTVFLQYYLLGYLVFGVIYTLLNSKTVYECYMLICFEGDENMEAETSKKKKGERK